MWSDTKDGKTPMPTIVTKRLLYHIEATYNVDQDRSTRHVQGFSMGGYGAALLELKHQDVFATITILDGAMHNWETISSVRESIVKKQFANDEEYFNQWSPWYWADKANLSQTPIFIIEGLMVNYNTRYYNRLKELGANVHKVSPNCLHDVKYLEETYGTQAFSFMHTKGQKFLQTK